MRAKPVHVVYEGETNPKLAGIGVLVALVGLVAMQVSSGFGGLLLLVGAVLVFAGFQKTTKPCPHCRTKISPRAAVCPQCHVTLRPAEAPAPAVPK